MCSSPILAPEPGRTPQRPPPWALGRRADLPRRCPQRLAIDQLGASRSTSCRLEGIRRRTLEHNPPSSSRHRLCPPPLARSLPPSPPRLGSLPPPHAGRGELRGRARLLLRVRFAPSREMGTAMGLPKPGAAAVADADDDGGAGATHPQGAAGGVEHEENVQPGEEVRDPQASATADALNSGTPDSEKLVDQSVEVKDETDESKTPIFNAAKIEASKAKAMVEQLKVAATRLKFGRMKPMKPSKVAVWASYSSDRRILSEYVEALEKAAVEKKGMIVPCPPLARFCINPNLDVNPTHLSERKQRVKRGIDLVRMKGSFAVPTSFVSGNCHIDSMNLILFDVYMHVNSLLAGAQSIAEVAEAGMHEPQIEDAKAECRAAVHELRKTAHDIRASILDVGGLQLREPSLYWWDICLPGSNGLILHLRSVMFC